jgi:hypothetical protein
MLLTPSGPKASLRNYKASNGKQSITAGKAITDLEQPPAGRSVEDCRIIRGLAMASIRPQQQ